MAPGTTRLQDRVAVVTGGVQGTGSAVAPPCAKGSAG